MIGFFDSTARDLHHALRSLSRRAAFTFVAVFTFALGIGATTAIFSVVYSVLIKPLPYPNADELVRIRHRSAFDSLSGPDVVGGSEPSIYFSYRDETRTLARIGLWLEGSATLSVRFRARFLRDVANCWTAPDIDPKYASSTARLKLGFSIWHRWTYAGRRPSHDRRLAAMGGPLRRGLS
jgi:hypothetical protein